MAITHKSESQVGGIKPSSGEIVDAVSCGSLNLREPNGISGVVKRFEPRRNQTKNNASDSLSDIDDAEVGRYLNTKEETHYKRMLWEAINGKYVNAKKQKKAAKRKKGGPLNKVAKTTEKVKSPKRSSRINYDALKVLYEELEHGSEASQSQIIPPDSHTLRSEDTPRLVMLGSNGSNEMSFDEENDTFGNNSSDFCGQYGNEHYTGDFYDRYGDEHHSDGCFVFD